MIGPKLPVAQMVGMFPVVLDNLFFNGSISVGDCAKTENLYSAFEAVPGPAGYLSRTASYALYRFLCLSQSASKMYDFVAAGASIFSFRPSYNKLIS